MLRSLHSGPASDALVCLLVGIGVAVPYILEAFGYRMNLQALRAEQDTQEVFNYMEAHKGRLLLPDQDIISALYGQRILPLDAVRYNMTEKLYALHRREETGMTLEDVRQQSAVIHYCGRNKPWKSGYIGELNVFYEEIVSQMKKTMPALAERISEL